VTRKIEELLSIGTETYHLEGGPMNVVAPQETDFTLPPGTELIIFAKEQPQYQQLPAFRTPDGRVVSQWQLTDEEKAALLDGKPLTLILHTFSSRCPQCKASLGLTPVSLSVPICPMDLT
jgi:hypothetical protein